jgi:hypothetical protein
VTAFLKQPLSSLMFKPLIHAHDPAANIIIFHTVAQLLRNVFRKDAVRPSFTNIVADVEINLIQASQSLNERPVKMEIASAVKKRRSQEEKVGASSFSPPHILWRHG